jgi:catechol 2,3-dioxygenase-like lactoylglutathione lyase family enzyme
MPVVKVIGLDHIVLRCADVERSLEFYCGVLGLEPERVDEWRRGDVLFPSVRITSTTIIDLFPAESSGDAGEADRRGGGAGVDQLSRQNLDHFCVVIEPADLDALAAHFPDHKRADGLFGAQGFASSLYVHDPDGNTVELRSYV